MVPFSFSNWLTFTWWHTVIWIFLTIFYLYFVYSVGFEYSFIATQLKDLYLPYDQNHIGYKHTGTYIDFRIMP